MSVAGGLENGPLNGTAIGADAIQIFTRNQRTWKHAPLREEEVAAFKDARDSCGTRVVLSHGAYLLNLCSTDAATLRRSCQGLVAEIHRCHRLGVEILVFHPGSHGGVGESTGVKTVARSLDRVAGLTENAESVVLALETTAGQGTSVGHRFEHLGDILDRVRSPDRFGICLDTAHIFAAGYDLRTRADHEKTLTAFDRTVGLDRLVALHLNDSRSQLGSRVDRHADIGEGHLGIRVFTRLVRDPRLENLPAVLETPGGMERWKRDIKRLRRARSRGARPREGTKKPAS